MPEPAGNAPNTLPAPAHERLALAAAGLACSVYILHSLPAILFPTGVLASLLTLLAGVLLGLAGAAGALALAFYHLTRRATPSNSGAAEQLRPSGRWRRSRHVSSCAATVPGATPPHAIAVQGELSGVLYTAPASAWRRADTVAAWPPTCDPSQPFRAWEASLSQGTLVLRPLVPPSPGRDGGNRGATAVAGPSGQGLAEGGSTAGGSAGATASAAAAPVSSGSTTAAATCGPIVRTKVGIPLEGCTVELVMEGLKGRSEWIRRAPLLVRHPKWNLLDGEPAFYLWADDPASKQQWLHALGWWCQDGERLTAIDAMYRAYCQAMRDRSCLEYAEHAPQLGPPAAGAAAEHGNDGSAGPEGTEPVAGQAASSGRRSGWKGWGANKVQNMRRKMQERRGRSGAGPISTDIQDAEASTGAEGSSRAGHAGPNSSPAKPSAAASPAGKAAEGAGLAAELQSIESIMEARWMQSRKITVPPAISEAVERSRHGSRSTSQASSPKAIPRPVCASASSEVPGSLAAAHGSLGSSVVGSLPSEGGSATPSLGTSPAIGAGQQLLAGGSALRQVDGSPALPAGALPPGSPLDRPRLAPAPQLPPPSGGLAAQQQQAAAGMGALAGATGGSSAAAAAPLLAPPAPGGAAAAALPEGMPPVLSPDYAVNAFVTRLGFDLLRRPDFHEHLRCRIQRQLSRLQRPEYIQSLEVVGVDAGGAAPTLKNLRALAQPEGSIWPQLLFDMRYQGAFTVTIEMKVDIRDAAAWGKLDKALTRLAEGRRRGSRAGSGSGGLDDAGQQHPPLHAASAPALRSSSSGHGVEEDYEEELAELDTPGSPDSSAASSVAAQEGPAASSSGSSKGAKAGGSRGVFGGIRQSAAKKLRQLAESTAVHISRIPLRLSLTFSVLEGTMCAWLPPPPGNRLFYSFVAPPTLELTARPEMAGRLLKYSYHVARVSHWVEHRMRAAITRNMVFPGGGDILLPPLMALEHPNAADGLPSLGRYMQQAAVAAASKEQAGGDAATPEAADAAHRADKEGGSTGEVQAAAATALPAGAAEPGPDAAEKAAPAAEATPATGAAPAEPASSDPLQEQQAAQAAAAGAATLPPPPAAAGAEGEPSSSVVQPQQEQGREQAGAAPPPAQLQQVQPQQRTSSVEELLGEPSLCLASSLQQQQQQQQQPEEAEAGSSAVAAAGSVEQEGASEPGNGASGHLISPRYGSAAGGSAGAGAAATSSGGAEEEAGAAAAAAAAAAPEFQGWAPPQQPGASNGFGRAPAGCMGRTRSAADAWEAAMAQEARAAEAPTPRFASQQWQAQPPAPLAAGLGLSPGDPSSAPADASPAPAAASPAPADAAGLPPQQPALQLKLSATRSLDPDFTRSAEHTGFGESPANALPDYGGGSTRRSLSARGEAASSGNCAPGSARSSRDAVGAAISRSLASLRRQGSSLKQHQAQEAATHAGHLLQQQQQHLPPAQQGQAQHASSPQQHHSPAQQQHSPASSPPQEGGSSPLPGDPRRLRASGSLKEQAGKFLTRMNAAGKAFASQVHDMQQQRAAARMARTTTGGSSGSGADSEAQQQPASTSVLQRSPSQQDTL